VAVLLLTCMQALAIQIDPTTKDMYPIPGVCGTWMLGIQQNHPPCRAVNTGGGGLHYEKLVGTQMSIGPKINAAKDEFSFGDGTFTTTTTYWADAPCFTRKKTCTQWDHVATISDSGGGCPKQYQRNCPSYQNRFMNPKLCGGQSNVPGYGTDPFCFGHACKPSVCPDEEFYPGCGALHTGQNMDAKGEIVKCTAPPCDFWEPGDGTGTSKFEGMQQMIISMSGTWMNMFDVDADPLAIQSCELICPCKRVNNDWCIWSVQPDFVPSGDQPNRKFTCSQSDFNAYKQCLGCCKCDAPSGLCSATGDQAWKCPSNAPRVPCTGDATTTPLERTSSNVAYADPMASIWEVPYHSKYDPQYSKPVRFIVGAIHVTPTSKAQTEYLTNTCPCVKWTMGVSMDISECNPSDCAYLSAQSLFAGNKTVIPNCPSGKRCLFAQMYPHQTNFLYIGKVQPTYSQMMRSPIYGDGVYSLTSTKPGCVGAASSTTASVAFAGMLSLLIAAFATQ